ncbi:uncharacterized protein AB675_38 [Cyphellophora attinorum]|uniref:Uncharacterized protein n=1 Tax=Cyphellophora attinorum TaxID=1664694 RepID=A0A0N1H1M7_9EURO|nr:uncharacterized protein AB675_38 [Phialophora attinorum]KPI34766.1 hypothetical protein AB675_38 [Phialophora attinorum]
MSIAVSAFSRRQATRYGLLAAVFFIATFLILQLYAPLSFNSDYNYNPSSSTKNLHIAVFATSSNYHLCQLQLSAGLLGYPAPILLNYGADEDKDEMKQHLAKIEGAIQYLDSLPASQQDDLVFMLDGFDIWFQLPHSYIVKRYYDVVKRSHQRHISTFGEALVKKHNIRNTVIFGPDKSCAPAGNDHSSCWAIPESWMEPLSFGPDTDHGRAMHNRPRWLNSGTVMGPARELKDVFERALEQNKHRHVTDSDQFYFSHVFGLQSYARRVHKFEDDRARGCDVAADQEFLLPADVDAKKKDIPKIKGERTEYHIGLDWSSDIFQTAGFYADYLTWIRHNSTSLYVQETAKEGNYHHHFSLPTDLIGNGPEPLSDAVDPALADWRNLPLATNTASRTVPPVIHINGKKGYRHLWWPRNWFYPYIEKMLESKRNTLSWDDELPKDMPALAGAWTFNNGQTDWVGFNETCGRWEDALMGKARPPGN